MNTITLSNRLGESTSPYLQQHKDNPVHWLPWGEEAFRLARELDRPILLSSGYAACHWCHVMAHESFENPEIAAIMNEHFINVKVDREERPDVDHLYMQALRMMGEQGGWPLTMFLTPDGTPFWGGTYFPPEPRYGRPGFAQVLREIARVWREQREKILEHAGKLDAALKEQSRDEAASSLPPAELPAQVSKALVQYFDPEKGGLGGAPKFPQCPALDLLLHAGNATARHHVHNTLRHMAQGGIYDHLGGGFARYSTDELWLVPHFEKMLYDNAQLITTMSIAWLQTQEELFRVRIEETIAFMEREMRIKGAGYAASFDADSEGEEGKFYVFTYEELKRLIPDEQDFQLFAQVYDVQPRGNWEGKIILNRRHALELLDAETEERLARIRQRLFEARARRIPPARDDKVLASWNGLAITALVHAGLAFDQAKWLALAEERMQEVLGVLLVDGTLRQSFNRTVSDTPATADGVANMLRAALLLFEATADPAHRDTADLLLRQMMDHYLAESGDAFHYTHESVADVPLRQIVAEDDAMPSYHGVMVENLLHLHHLTGDAAHRDLAERILKRFARPMSESPLAYATLLKGLWLWHEGTKVVLAHEEEELANAGDSRETARGLLHAFIRHTALIPPIAHLKPGDDTSALPPHLQAAAATQQRPALIACRGQTCAMPVHTAANIPDALELLRQTA